MKINQVKSTRWDEIDALRGLAVLTMVFSHALCWSYAGSTLGIYGLFGNLTPGDLATLLFYLAAGMSMYFSLQSRVQRFLDPESLRREYTIRLGKLFLIGVFMSLGWGVLQAQAITLFILIHLVLFLSERCSFRSVRSFLPMIIAALLGGHFFLAGCSLPSYWEGVLAGQFPLLAVLSINALGFYLAPCFHMRFFSARVMHTGLGLIGAALFLREKGIPMVRHGATITFLLLGIGIGFLLLGIFHFSRVKKTFFFRYLVQIGKDALFLFVFHYVVFFLPLYFSGFMEKMSAASALIFSSVAALTVIITAKLRQGSNFTVYDLFDSILENIQFLLLRLLGQKAAIFWRRPLPGSEKTGLQQ